MTKVVQIPMFKLEQFSKATELTKQRIIKDLFSNYKPQSRHVKAKNCISNCLTNQFDTSCIDQGLNYIKNKLYVDDWEKENSIKTLQNFKKTTFHFNEDFIFKKNENKKDIEINGLSIYVNPELIIKEIRNDITYLGAIKINISKSTQDKIDYDFCRTIVFEFLKSIAKDGELVDFKMIYFYTPLNNKWNNSNSMIHTQIIENTIYEFLIYLHKLNAA